MIELTHFHIVLFLLASSSSLLQHATNAQTASQPVASSALNQSGNQFLAVLIVFMVFAFLIMAFFSFYLHCTEAYVISGNPIGSCGTQGIDSKLLATFPIMVYSTVKDLKSGNGELQCAVCLSEFKDCETIRLLPRCSHCFHPDCIDAWLASHVTCPVCRAKLKPDCGEIAIVVGGETNAHQVLDESSVRRAEVGAAEQQQPVVPNMNEAHQGNGNVDRCIGKQNNSSKLRSLGMLVRSHSTGHSLLEPEKDLERYTLRLPEEVKKHILELHGSMMRRSASCDVVLQMEENSKKGWGTNEGEGSSQEKKDGVERQQNWWVLSMTTPFVSRGWGSSSATPIESSSCSGIPRFWASSSRPLHPL